MNKTQEKLVAFMFGVIVSAGILAGAVWLSAWPNTSPASAPLHGTWVADYDDTEAHPANSHKSDADLKSFLWLWCIQREDRLRFSPDGRYSFWARWEDNPSFRYRVVARDGNSLWVRIDIHGPPIYKTIDLLPGKRIAAPHGSGIVVFHRED